MKQQETEICKKLVILGKTLSDVLSKTPSSIDIKSPYYHARLALRQFTNLSEVIRDKGLLDGIGSTFEEYSDKAARTRSDPNEVISSLLSDKEAYQTLSLFCKLAKQMISMSPDLDNLKKKLFYGSFKEQIKPLNAKEYQEDIDAIVCTLIDGSDSLLMVDLLHSVMGMITEAFELFEHIFNVLTERESLDVVNIEEELGDSMWYQSLAISGLDLNFQTILEKNIAKLEKRYPDKMFSPDHAKNRDLDAEREILEMEHV
jgi:NTP pyrophosphatase (non-canonical NTP hydrolase)